MPRPPLTEAELAFGKALSHFLHDLCEPTPTQKWLASDRTTALLAKFRAEDETTEPEENDGPDAQDLYLMRCDAAHDESRGK